MSKAPLVSAIVPSYNYASTVVAAVESVVAQQFDDFEVIVVENVSTDDSAERLKARFGDDPRVRLYLETEHVGMSANWNRGLRYARGRYAALCAADDTWYPHHLASLLPRLLESPGASMVYSRADLVDNDGRPIDSPFDIEPDDGKFFERLLLRGVFVPCMSVVFDRELVLERGGFREDLAIAMDSDMWLRLSIDREVRHVDQVTIRVLAHGQNASAGSTLTSERNRRDLVRIVSSLLEHHREALRARGLERAAEQRLAAQLARLARRTPDPVEARDSYRRALALQPWQMWWYAGLALASVRAAAGRSR